MFRKLHLVMVLGIVLCLAPIFLLQRDPSESHYELVTERQMARSPAYGAFALNSNFPDGITFQERPKGTIPRGWQPRYFFDERTGTLKDTGELDPQGQPFSYGSEPNDTNEMVRAGKELKNPLSFAQPEVRERGEFLYAAYCQSCHGEDGSGNGPVSKRGFPKPLSFLDDLALPKPKQLKDGAMFHIVTYGKGNMPAHAVQLTPSDRWAVILRVRVLQNQHTEYPNVSLADTVQVFKANCAACHGEDGAGSLMRGKLPNLPDFSSLAWQLAKTNLEITNRIAYGDEPLMPAFRYRLTRDQILGLAIYIRSFAAKEGGPNSTPAPPPTAAGMTAVQIFRAYCLACHNVDGKGAIVRPGMPDIPDFTLAEWHAKKKDDAELSKAILSGGKFMPAMKDKLTLEDAGKMVQYIRAFKDGKQVVALEGQEVPKTFGVFLAAQSPYGALAALSALAVPRPPKDIDIDTTKGGGGAAELAQRQRAGGILFREYCIVCHGPDGTGAPAMRPALPTLPDFTKPTFRDQHSDGQLLISILDGKGSFMPANRGRINEAQARDAVAFIRAFAPGGGSTPFPPNEYQKQFEELRRQWEALQRDIQALKKTPAKE